MLKCWEEDPTDRPTFEKLTETMKEMEKNHLVSLAFWGPHFVYYKLHDI